MKKTVLISILSTSLIISIYVAPAPLPVLKTGNLSFHKIEVTNECFSVKIHGTIPPYSRVFFTDTEWNGHRFAMDEHTLVWNSGRDYIYSGSMIYFKNISVSPTVSIGKATGKLRITPYKDAIFAYQGTERMPTHFISGIAFHISNYGTLENTGLSIDSTAFILNQQYSN